MNHSVATSDSLVRCRNQVEKSKPDNSCGQSLSGSSIIFGIVESVIANLTRL